MAVIVGSARIDENGKTTGGKAGDQTGKEVSTQNWYLHDKGWVVLRANDPLAAELIAVCMAAACANNKIGYDQLQRDTLYNLAKLVKFDCALVDIACETDCSALVRVCLAYAGVAIGDINTGTMAGVIMATGKFSKLTESKYTTQSAYLKRGDILVTQKKGHTVVVLSNGSKAGTSGTATATYPMIQKGSKGTSVATAQELLIAAGYKLPKYGVDGDFGDETEAAVKAFQKAQGLEVDGVVGPLTWAALMNGAATNAKYVELVGGDYWLRSAPVTGQTLVPALKGERLTYLGETTAEGWHKAQRGDVKGYISGIGTKLAG